MRHTRAASPGSPGADVQRPMPTSRNLYRKPARHRFGTATKSRCDTPLSGDPNPTGGLPVRPPRGRQRDRRAVTAPPSRSSWLRLFATADVESHESPQRRRRRAPAARTTGAIGQLCIPRRDRQRAAPLEGRAASGSPWRGEEACSCHAFFQFRNSLPQRHEGTLCAANSP